MTGLSGPSALSRASASSGLSGPSALTVNLTETQKEISQQMRKIAEGQIRNSGQLDLGKLKKTVTQICTDRSINYVDFVSFCIEECKEANSSDEHDNQIFQFLHREAAPAVSSDETISVNPQPKIPRLSSALEDLSLVYTLEANAQDCKSFAVGMLSDTADSILVLQEPNPLVFRNNTTNTFNIYVLVKGNVDGMGDNTVSIQEEDLDGTFTGYFEKQFEDSTIPRGHSPFCGKRNIERGYKFSDTVGICLGAEIPFSNGTARWEIPMTLTIGQKTKTKTVVQQFEIKDNQFIVSKGRYQICSITLVG